MNFWCASKASSTHYMQHFHQPLLYTIWHLRYWHKCLDTNTNGNNIPSHYILMNVNLCMTCKLCLCLVFPIFLLIGITTLHASETRKICRNSFTFQYLYTYEARHHLNFLMNSNWATYNIYFGFLYETSLWKWMKS